MRVLLVSHRFPPDSVAGVERYTETLGRELGRRGCHVAVATRRADGSRGMRPQRDRRGDGLSVHRFRGGDIHLDRFLAHYAPLERLYMRTLLEERPDVVHVNHLLGLSPRFVDLARRSGIPVVLSLHDFFLACPLAHLEKVDGTLCAGPAGGLECASTCFAGEGPSAAIRWSVRCAYYRALLASVDRVICPPGHLAEYFLAFGADPARMRQVPLGIGVTAEPVAPPAEEAERLVLAYFGVVTRHKGVHLAIDAIARAGLGNVELRVIGVVPDRAYADALRRDAAGVDGLQLRLYGGYDAPQLPHLLAGVDAAVMPSLVPEAFPLSPRESLALGVPVVASRLGGLPEIVDDGVNGLVFDPAAPDELASALARLAGDEELRARLRAGARATRVYSIAEHAEAVLAVYEEVVRDPADEPAAAAAEREGLFTAMVNLGLAEEVEAG